MPHGPARPSPGRPATRRLFSRRHAKHLGQITDRSGTRRLREPAFRHLDKIPPTHPERCPGGGICRNRPAGSRISRWMSVDVRRAYGGRFPARSRLGERAADHDYARSFASVPLSLSSPASPGILTTGAVASRALPRGSFAWMQISRMRLVPETLPPCPAPNHDVDTLPRSPTGSADMVRHSLAAGAGRHHR